MHHHVRRMHALSRIGIMRAACRMDMMIPAPPAELCHINPPLHHHCHSQSLFPTPRVPSPTAAILPIPTPAQRAGHLRRAAATPRFRQSTSLQRLLTQGVRPATITPARTTEGKLRVNKHADTAFGFPASVAECRSSCGVIKNPYFA